MTVTIGIDPHKSTHTAVAVDFRTRAQFASYNGTAPIEASSAAVSLHRLTRAATAP